MASRSRIVGAMNSQAIALSDRPRMRRASGAGVAPATLSATFAFAEESVIRRDPGLRLSVGLSVA